MSEELKKQMDNADKVIHFLIEKYCGSSICSECPVHDECFSHGEYINKIESSTEK